MYLLGGLKMASKNQPFCHYFEEWIELYKKGAVRPVTYEKYVMTLRNLTKIAPKLKLSELDKRKYQSIINEYALTHERATTKDFNAHLKAAILDAMDEGLIKIDPTRKVVIKGKEPTRKKRPKFLSNEDLIKLVSVLDLSDIRNEENEVNWDWFILVLIKTGFRFAEALALTPQDFDFEKNTLSVTKSWNYKDFNNSRFQKTKNKSSVRTIIIDQNLSKDLKKLIKDMPADKPIFINGERIFSSVINDKLHQRCRKAGIPEVSMHSLRHTHASMLLYADVSIANISKRLGHANTTTTMEVYLHIIKELEDRENDKINSFLASI